MNYVISIILVIWLFFKACKSFDETVAAHKKAQAFWPFHNAKQNLVKKYEGTGTYPTLTINRDAIGEERYEQYVKELNVIEKKYGKPITEYVWRPSDPGERLRLQHKKMMAKYGIEVK